MTKVWPPVHELALARLRSTVPEPPSAIADPPIVTEPEEVRPMVEFASIALVIELAGRETEEVAVREPTESAPIEEEARYAWTP